MSVGDHELLARLGNGDVEAALEFEARSAPPLLAFFGCLVRGNSVLAADLCLETLATARLKAHWFDRAHDEVGAWLVELAAEVLRSSAEARKVVSEARRRGCRPEPADLTAEDLERIPEYIGDRHGVRALGEPGTESAEHALARAPDPEALKRLRPSGLVRQIGAEAPTTDLDRWDDAK